MFLDSHSSRPHSNAAPRGATRPSVRTANQRGCSVRGPRSERSRKGHSVSLLVPCDYCGSRAKGKNSWLAWAWNRADNVRVCYKQRLCVDCFMANALNLIASASDGQYACPVCHSDPGQQLDPIWLTYIVPGSAQEQGEFATCGPCAVEVRLRAQQGSTMLEDRTLEVGAENRGPHSSATSAWDALGLRPDR